MYYPNWIEDLCYEPAHVSQVLQALRNGFSDYYPAFLETRSGAVVGDQAARELAQHFGGTFDPAPRRPVSSAVLTDILQSGVDNFEKNRTCYLNLFDEAYIEEFQSDPSLFKNTELRKNCPIIRVTLQNHKAKALDKYRAKFKSADPAALLQVVERIAAFARRYAQSVYRADVHESATSPDQLGLDELGGEEYSVYGVIGDGIRSHFLYKFFPEAFSNRSQDALWALWYLTGKHHFGCKQDSEFLMIDVKKSITQQNYFYPYDLFTVYALEIWRLINAELKKSRIPFGREYRYVAVDLFLSYIAAQHEKEIADLKAEVSDASYT